MTNPDAMPPATASLQSIPIDQLHPNPWNRKQFDPQEMEGLIQSIKAGGVRVRLIVRPRRLSENCHFLVENAHVDLSEQRGANWVESVNTPTGS